MNILKLGGGFKYFLFSPLFGEMIQFDKYFSNGLKPPTSGCLGFIGNDILPSYMGIMMISYMLI